MCPHSGESLLRGTQFSEASISYRSNRSTQTAWHRFMIDILDGVKYGLIGGICIFDLKKCFGTIDQEAAMWNHRCGIEIIRIIFV